MHRLSTFTVPGTLGERRKGIRHKNIFGECQKVRCLKQCRGGGGKEGEGPEEDGLECLRQRGLTVFESNGAFEVLHTRDDTTVMNIYCVLILGKHGSSLNPHCHNFSCLADVETETQKNELDPRPHSSDTADLGLTLDSWIPQSAPSTKKLCYFEVTKPSNAVTSRLEGRIRSRDRLGRHYSQPRDEARKTETAVQTVRQRVF